MALSFGLLSSHSTTDTTYLFDLEALNTDLRGDRLRTHKNISQVGGPPPPLEVQILLAVPELTNNQVLVHNPPNKS